jgi:hypothetical protein
MIKLRTSPGKGFEIPFSKRSFEVAQTCARTWIPVVPDALTSLQRRVQSGEFKVNKERHLCRELRRDIGLYLHTFFHLCLNKEPSSSSTPESILGCVEKCSVRGIGNLIAGVPANFGSAEIKEMGEYQAKVLRFALVASNSAVLLAERADVDEGMTYSLSLFRNLGNLLTSWSYPAAFNRAAENWSQGRGNLILNLEHSLNASALEVAFLLIRGLHLGDKICSVILNPGDMVPERGEGANDASGALRRSSLEKAIRFCEIGEALARLSDSECYPLSAKEWEYVSRDVTYYLGRNCIVQINECVAAASELYLDYQPEVFNKVLNPERDVLLAKKAYNIHRFNRATQGIPMADSIRDIFESVYRLMAFDKASRSALEVLFSDVLPDLEFEQAGLFIYDPKKDLLTPRSSYGNDDWPLQPISVSTPGELQRLVYESRTSAAPLRLDRLYANTVTRSYLAWKFGNRESQGVLFLGYGRALRTLPARTLLSYFALVRQTANDALFVENDSAVQL